MQQHIIATLQKAGVHRQHRHKALLGHARRRGHGVALGNAHIEKAAGVGLGEFRQPRTVHHGGSQGADAAVLPRQSSQCLTEDGGKTGCGGLAAAGTDIEGPDAMEPAGIRLGGAVALPLHRVDMEQHRTAEIFSLPQHPGQLDHVVAVHRPHIRKAHVFKQGAAGKQGLFQRRFHVVADGIELLPRLGGLQHLTVALFEGVVAGLAAQA